MNMESLYGRWRQHEYGYDVAGPDSDDTVSLREECNTTEHNYLLPLRKGPIGQALVLFEGRCISATTSLKFRSVT